MYRTYIGICRTYLQLTETLGLRSSARRKPTKQRFHFKFQTSLSTYIQVPTRERPIETTTKIVRLFAVHSTPIIVVFSSAQEEKRRGDGGRRGNNIRIFSFYRIFGLFFSVELFLHAIFLHENPNA